ncbi:K(+)-transporting ATPase subunit F [Gordonia sp. DT30]
MTADGTINIVLLALAVLTVGYLMYALIFPERF